MKKHALIVAHDEVLGIGRDNKLRHFRDLTSISKNDELKEGKTKNVVIMGRKTWESLPANFRPLPHRINLVISRNANYSLPPDVLLCKSLEESLATLQEMKHGDIFVIGGAAIYQMAINTKIFDTLYVTEIKGQYDCDAFFPEYRESFEIFKSSDLISEENHQFVFKTLNRKP
jgi:dihydrofolate reductase